jgi:hypothetical protein
MDGLGAAATAGGRELLAVEMCLKAAMIHEHWNRHLEAAGMRVAAGEAIAGSDPRLAAQLLQSAGASLGLKLTEEAPGGKGDPEPGAPDTEAALALPAAYLRRALELLERELGPDHPDSLQGAERLASILMTVTHSWGEALPILERVHSARVAAIGPDAPRTLDALFLMAEAIGQAGDQAKSTELHLSCLTARERVLGKGSGDTRFSMAAVANHAGFAASEARKAGDTAAARRFGVLSESLFAKLEALNELDELDEFGDLFQPE